MCLTTITTVCINLNYTVQENACLSMLPTAHHNLFVLKLQHDTRPSYFLTSTSIKSREERYNLQSATSIMAPSIHTHSGLMVSWSLSSGGSPPSAFRFVAILVLFDPWLFLFKTTCCDERVNFYIINQRLSCCHPRKIDRKILRGSFKVVCLLETNMIYVLV